MSTKRIKKYVIISAVLCVLNITGCGKQQSEVKNIVTPFPTSVTETNVSTPTPAPTPKEILSYKVNEVEHFCNGIAWISAYSKEKKDQKYVAVNEAGEVVYANSESNEYIVHPTNGLTASPDTHGYTEILAGGDGYYIVLKKEEGFDSVTSKVGCITSDGKIVMEPRFLPNGRNISGAEYLGEGCFAISEFYDLSPSFLYNASTNSWSSESDDYSNLYTPNQLKYDSGKCAMINANGDIAVDLSEYKGKILSTFSDKEYILLELEGADQKHYYCVLKDNGETVVSPTLYGKGSISNIDNGYFIAETNYNTIASISVDGTVGNITHVDYSLPSLILHNGWLILSENGKKVNFINLDGELMFPDETIELTID